MSFGFASRTKTATRNLPNMDSTGKRAAAERGLHIWVQRGALHVAMIDPDDPEARTYRVVTRDGTEWQRLSLKEVRLLCHGLASAWHAHEKAAQQD